MADGETECQRVSMVAGDAPALCNWGVAQAPVVMLTLR
jgi:hypothetical protein